MRRPQFSIKTILWLMLVASLVAHSFYERERHRREVRKLKIENTMLDAKLAEATGRGPSA